MKAWSFIRRYVVRYTGWFVAGTLSLIATNALAVSIPLEVAAALDALGDPTKIGTVPQKALWIAGMGVAVIAVRTASRVLFFNPGRLIEAKLKHDLFERLLHQQPAFLRKYPPGDLISRATSDVNNIRLLVGFGALQILNTAIAIVMAGGQMFRISPFLATVVAFPVIIALIANQGFIRILFRLIHEMQQQIAALSDHILSSYQGVATIQSFCAEPAFLKQFDEKNHAYLASSVKRSNLRALIGPLLGLAAALDVFLLLWFGGPRAISGEISPGEFVAFLTLVAMLINPLRATSFLLSIGRQGRVALDRLGEVMDPEPERPDLPNPTPAPLAPPAIEVRNLQFSYPNAEDKPVLHGISFRAAEGTTIGILGPTGSGKTTLLRCLARLFNPPEGSIFVNNTDIRRLDLDDWRRTVSFVPQRNFLFSDTLRENILMGAPDADRLQPMLTLTTLDVDIASLPQGAESPVGESGIMLSGGQRQRVALARGLMRPHRVLLLDDVLSAVDHATEQALVDALRAQSNHPTTFIVAHRISAIEHAQWILVLENGRIVDQGHHQDLIHRPGFYRETWLHQQENER